MNLRKIISTVTLFAISCSFAFNVSAEESKKISRDELLEIATGYTSYTLDGEYIDFETFTVLSRMMDYEFVNYGIGGYIFNPDQFVGQGVFEPDIVFVAYGANDAGCIPI